MKRLKVLNLIILLCLLSQGCDSENAADCFQTAGPLIITEVEVGSFDRILVNRDIEVILKTSPNYKVVVQTGENLLNDIDISVVDNQLELTDYNTCNFVRDYGITKIYIEAPDIKEIRSSSQYTVSSDGVLSYPDLTLFSENFENSSFFTVGDFDLSLNGTSLDIISNNISIFYIDGNVEHLTIGFFAGAGRFEGADLEANTVEVFHRGSNDMIVNPQISITGELRSTGDLILMSQPDSIAVQQFYTGEIIIN